MTIDCYKLLWLTHFPVEISNEYEKYEPNSQFQVGSKSMNSAFYNCIRLYNIVCNPRTKEKQIKRKDKKATE